jgi:hypothetical protein
MYKTNYDNINKIDIEQALKIHNDLDSYNQIGISYFEDIDNFKIKEIHGVIISLARRIAELEHEWS